MKSFMKHYLSCYRWISFPNWHSVSFRDCLFRRRSTLSLWVSGCSQVKNNSKSNRCSSLQGCTVTFTSWRSFPTWSSQRSRLRSSGWSSSCRVREWSTFTSTSNPSCRTTTTTRTYPTSTSISSATILNSSMSISYYASTQKASFKPWASWTMTFRLLRKYSTSSLAAFLKVVKGSISTSKLKKIVSVSGRARTNPCLPRLSLIFWVRYGSNGVERYKSNIVRPQLSIT